MTNTAVAHTPITWFEIPTNDVEAAAAFYESVLLTTLEREVFATAKMAIFPGSGGGFGGCLCEGKGLAPRGQGAVVYLRVPDTMEATTARWEKAGGKLLSPIVELPRGIGRIVQVLDAEGGRVALHEPKQAA